MIRRRRVAAGSSRVAASEAAATVVGASAVDGVSATVSTVSVVVGVVSVTVVATGSVVDVRWTAEAGNAWFDGHDHTTRYSTTVFVAVDSKIGDIYLGLARGSGGASNAFVQLGRRFGW